MLRSSVTSVRLPLAFFINLIEPSKESMACQQTLELNDGFFLAELPQIFSKLLAAKPNTNDQFKQRRNMSF